MRSQVQVSKYVCAAGDPAPDRRAFAAPRAAMALRLAAAAAARLVPDAASAVAFAAAARAVPRAAAADAAAAAAASAHFAFLCARLHAATSAQASSSTSAQPAPSPVSDDPDSILEQALSQVATAPKQLKKARAAVVTGGGGDLPACAVRHLLRSLALSHAYGATVGMSSYEGRTEGVAPPPGGGAAAAAGGSARDAPLDSRGDGLALGTSGLGDGDTGGDDLDGGGGGLSAVATPLHVPLALSLLRASGEAAAAFRAGWPAAPLHALLPWAPQMLSMLVAEVPGAMRHSEL
jgi:DNA-dependent protein kinase catalytic subunit